MGLVLNILRWPYAAANGPAVAGWGFWFAVVGFAATWYGLWLAIKQLRATQTAVEANNAAIDAVKFRVTQFEAAGEVARAKSALDLARDAIEIGEWRRAATSYEEVRRSLIHLRSDRVHLQGDVLSGMGTTVRQISAFCKKVDIRLHDGGALPEIALSLENSRKHYDVLHEIAEHLQVRAF